MIDYICKDNCSDKLCVFKEYFEKPGREHKKYINDRKKFFEGRKRASCIFHKSLENYLIMIIEEDNEDTQDSEDMS